MDTSKEKNTATFTHLSTLTQYFIPFGNFILPLVIWSSFKKDSTFVDSHGKQAINFQLSVFLYTLALCLIAIPILVYAIFKNVPLASIIHNEDFIFENLNIGNITTAVTIALVALFVLLLMKIGEFFLVIIASVKAANGDEYNYPMTIKFIK